MSRVLSLVLLLGNLEFADRDVSGTPHAEVSFMAWGSAKFPRVQYSVAPRNCGQGVLEFDSPF